MDNKKKLSHEFLVHIGRCICLVINLHTEPTLKIHFIPTILTYTSYIVNPENFHVDNAFAEIFF